MNRVVVLGAATFFAMLAIALTGGADKAVAGHGCSGCEGDVVACSGDDCASSCHGGLFARLRAKMRSRCCGVPTNCCGEVAEPVCEPAPADDCCGAPVDCGGRKRLFNRCHGRERCHGLLKRMRSCCGEPVACCG